MLGSDPDVDPCTWRPIVAVGAASTAGGYSPRERKVNQDRFGCAMDAKSGPVLVVCDGHGDDGELVSTCVRDECLRILTGSDAGLAPDELCAKIAAKVQKDLGPLAMLSGSTMVACFDNGSQVNVLNIGDSRCVAISEQGNAVALSRDHKPDDPKELKRINKVGGVVTKQRGGVARVGGLALSRAFGDLAIAKHGVISEGELVRVDKRGLQYVCLVSDGVVDVMENEELANLVAKWASSMSLEKVALKIVEECRARWWEETRGTYCDDITCAIRALAPESKAKL